MGEMNFNEEDKQKFVEFLNAIAKTAKFEVKTDELINYFKLLAHMQNKIIPKIDANILEVKNVVEVSKEPVKEETKKSKSKAITPIP
jgi:hypothetical protein